MYDAFIRAFNSLGLLSRVFWFRKLIKTMRKHGELLEKVY